MQPGKLWRPALLAMVAAFSIGFVSWATPGSTSQRVDATAVDLRLYSERHGQGPPLLLIHGFGASTYSWRHVIGPLSAQHTVITLDLKGFGRSPKPEDHAYSVHDQAALVKAFVLKNDLRRLTLVGHSFGGGVVLALSLALLDEDPGRLSGLVLIGSPAYRQRLPGFMTLLRTPVIGPASLRLLPATFQVKRILALAYHDDRKIPEAAVAVYAAPLSDPGGRHALVATARQIIPPDIDEIAARYPTIRVPTLLLWGAHDEIIPLEIGRRLREGLPNAKLVVVEQSGHIPHEEAPEVAVQAIEEFLAGVYGRAARQ